MAAAIKISKQRREAKGFIERFRGEKRLARRLILTNREAFWWSATKNSRQQTISSI
jgi:hypothetical protein